MTVPLDIGEGVAYNTIFSWPFLQTIKASRTTEKNALVSGLLGEQFRLEMMVPQRAKEAPKTSERLPVLFPVVIQEKRDNMKERGIRNSTM